MRSNWEANNFSHTPLGAIVKLTAAYWHVFLKQNIFQLFCSSASGKYNIVYIALCQKISSPLPWKCFSLSSRSPPLWILKLYKLPTFLWNFCLLDPSPSFLEFSINLPWDGYGCLLELYILATIRHCLDQSFPC